MQNKEQEARAIHRRGSGCSYAVYNVFADVNKKSTRPPMPRLEGGKCGAVLAAEKTLREMGVGRVEEFEARFLAEFGSLKCRDLCRKGVSCNDCVGRAAGIAQELMDR